MKPVATDDCNSVLKLPGGTDENDLPCRVEDGWTYSTWEMTEAERAAVLDSEQIVIWTWWPSLIGVHVRVGDAKRDHTEVDMPHKMLRGDEMTGSVIRYMVNLDASELREVRAGARVKLGIDMHPTCPVAVSATDYDDVEAGVA